MSSRVTLDPEYTIVWQVMQPFYNVYFQILKLKIFDEILRICPKRFSLFSLVLLQEK